MSNTPASERGVRSPVICKNGVVNMILSAKNMDFRTLNQQVKRADGNLCIQDCCGQRFIASGLRDKTVTIQGTPGNALGAYLDGAVIEVYGNVQDAVGDTMNAGEIIVHGSAGDALGYAMRGGAIYVRGNAGYRAGIHMKAYEQQQPVLVVGGRVGSFFGEYLAGGILIVLGLGCDGVPVGNFTGNGMHGGRIFIRTPLPLPDLPAQVTADIAPPEEMEAIAPYLQEFGRRFDIDAAGLLHDTFYLLRPNAKNPYQQLYTPN